MKPVSIAIGAACALWAALGGASAAGAPAMSKTTRADLECLVAIMESAPMLDKTHPGASQTAMMYYFGRLDGDDVKLDLEAAMRWEFAQMKPNAVRAADARCGAELTVRGKYLQRVGGNIAAHP